MATRRPGQQDEHKEIIRIIDAAICARETLALDRRTSSPRVVSPYLSGTNASGEQVFVCHAGRRPKVDGSLRLECVRVDDIKGIRRSSFPWITPPEPKGDGGRPFPCVQSARRNYADC